MEIQNRIGATRDQNSRAQIGMLIAETAAIATISILQSRLGKLG